MYEGKIQQKILSAILKLHNKPRLEIWTEKKMDATQGVRESSTTPNNARRISC